MQDSKHGHCRGRRGSPTHKSWEAMKQRCLNPRQTNYQNYGGRGITVCDRWEDFRNFLADMGEKPTGTTLDRIDNDGNYEPANCRWADWKTQANNRRPGTRPRLVGRIPRRKTRRKEVTPLGSERKGTGQRQGANLATVGDVAERLNLSKPRVYELGRSGRIPVIKVGPGKKGAVRFDWVDVEMFIRDHKRKQTA